MDKIQFNVPMNTNIATPSAYSEALSYFEDVQLFRALLKRVIDGLNALIDKEDSDYKDSLQQLANNVQALNTLIANNYNTLNNAKEDKSNLTNVRKLSPTGDFTGSWWGIEKPVHVEGGVDAIVLQLQSLLGDLTTLKTTDKSTIVHSINEILDSLNSYIESTNIKLNDNDTKLNFLQQLQLKFVYGAKGDGINDDSTAIQNAINTGHDIYFPDGNYKLTTTLQVNTVKQNLYFSGNAVLLACHSSDSVIEVNSEWVTVHNIKIQNGSGFNDTSNNGVTKFIKVNHWYFIMRGGILGGTNVGKYVTAIHFSDYSANPSVGTFVSTLDNVRIDGANVGIYFGEQSNVQRIINCHITNCTDGIQLNGSFPSWLCRGVCFEGNANAINFHKTGRKQDGLIGGEIANCYFENNTVALYISQGDIHNLDIKNIYCSGKGTGSYFLQINSSAVSGWLQDIKIDNCWVQNVETIFNLGTSTINRLKWEVTNIHKGSSVTNYSSGYFTDLVMMFNRVPTISNFLTYGGSYPASINIADMDNNNIFTNGGANGEIDYHLPKLGTNYYDLGYDGMKLTFIRRNGYSMKIYPDSTQIIGSASGVGKYLELQGSLSSVTIMAVTGGTWVVLSSNGTIGYEP